jgi:hypothetical protein
MWTKNLKGFRLLSRIENFIIDLSLWASFRWHMHRCSCPALHTTGSLVVSFFLMKPKMRRESDGRIS